MTQANKAWWHARNNERFGPYSAAELKAQAGQGKIAADDLVWKSGLPKWVPASAIKGLLPAELPPQTTQAADSPPPAGPPPIPAWQNAAQAPEIAAPSSYPSTSGYPPSRSGIPPLAIALVVAGVLALLLVLSKGKLPNLPGWPFSSESADVRFVKYGKPYFCPKVTLEKMTSRFMGSPTWVAGKKGDGTRFVNLSGSIKYHDQSALVTAQFIIDGDEFWLDSVLRDGENEDKAFADALFGKMCTEAQQ